ncbi:hypothetical protein CPB86DRAFT_741224 [Serendipita vermifera]|nr:hypothetical protein CPB86DRAFT_741224 [Serendipita vermifera]
MSKPLSLLPIAPNLLATLTKAGLMTVRDLAGYSSDDLATELKISLDNAQHILKLVHEPYSEFPNPQRTGNTVLGNNRDHTHQASSIPTTQSASALLEKRIIHNTRIPGIDAVLEGGLRSGQLLEIAGPPGSGKASLALEFLIVALNKNRSVLVIGMCDICACGCEFYCSPDCQNALSPSRLNGIIEDDTEGLVHRVSVNSYAELMAFMACLPTYLDEATSPISLILISSLSTVFQHAPNHNVKQRLLASFSTALARILSNVVYSVACVVTMQLSTRLKTADGSTANFETAGAKAIMLPALGDTWHPAQKTYRIRLLRNRFGKRLFCLTTSPAVPRITPSADAMKEFEISEEGRFQMGSGLYPDKGQGIDVNFGPLVLGQLVS